MHSNQGGAFMRHDNNTVKLRTVGLPRGTTLRAIFALLLREFATNNAAAFGGVMWAFIGPLASIVFMTLIFSSGFRSPPIGDVFAIFYATGVIPFSFFSVVSGKLSNAIRENSKILKYPRISVLDTILAKLLFVVLVQIIVSVLLLVAILNIWQTKTILDFGPILHAIALATLLGFGVGTVNAYLFQIAPTWRHLWSIATAPLFLLSCIIFTFEMVPQPFSDWLAFNPLVHIVGLSRTGFYHGYSAHYVDPLYPLLLGLGLSLIGLLLLNQGRARLLNN
ncbi:MAG: capsular polysaccharide transport system permease protein [Yoonia sp.]|jgi:capsular polysaccharide transport system permease protein